MEFTIGGDLKCDLTALIDTRLLIQANSGAGKSWCIRRILEQTHGQVQHLIIDPEGEFASLREHYDYVLAARHGGDTAADPRSAKLLAERLLELGVSAVLDIYELKAHERVRFVRLFIEALVDAPKKLWHPALVIVDEAHVYCPQKGDAESAGAIIDLATRGRKRGFCAVLATQRLSKLHKDAAAECNNKLIGRSSLDVDKKRAGEELGFSGREEENELRMLDPGEFYAFGPALARVVTQVKVGSVVTTHPKAGARLVAAPPPPTEQIQRLLPRLEDLPAEAEERQQTLDSLKRDLTTVRRELTIAKREQAPPDEAVIERRVATAVTAARLKHKAALELSQRNLIAIERYMGAGVALIQQGVEKLTGSLDGTQPPPLPTRAAPPAVAQSAERSPRPPAPPVAAGAGDGELNGDRELDGPERRILNAVAWLEALGIGEPEQPAVAFLAGYRYGGGGFNNPKARLKGGGLIEYLPGNGVRLTELGRGLAESPDVAPTDAALQEAVLARLEGPHRRLLQPLLDAYPEAMSNDELAEAANYAPGSGGYNNPRGRLKSLGLIEYPQPGMVVARALLFPERAT